MSFTMLSAWWCVHWGRTGIFFMKDKQSFIMYVEWIHTVEKLTDEQAGKLMKHLLRYVNDQNPVFSKDDFLLEIVFEPMKQNLKRDLKKWNDLREKRIKNGKIGGVKSGESRRKKQTKANEASASKTKQTKQVQANEAVNVNVNVNGNVNGNEKNNTPTPPSVDDFLMFAKELCGRAGQSYPSLAFSLTAKYESWVADGWKDGNGKPIKNWKTKLGNVLPHLKPINPTKNGSKKQHRTLREILGNDGNGE